MSTSNGAGVCALLNNFRRGGWTMASNRMEWSGRAIELKDEWMSEWRSEETREREHEGAKERRTEGML